MQLTSVKKLQYFQDLTTSLRMGTVKADRRVQLKMPKKIVEELDSQFPDIDRSHLITQLAADFLAQKMQFEDRPIFNHLQASEQSELNEMWKYLENRDAS